jgi:hypothetical protein
MGYPSETRRFDMPGFSRRGKDAYAQTIRDIIIEIQAIENELGITPSAAFDDLTARLADMTSDIATIEGYYITKNSVEYSSNAAQSIPDATSTILNFEDKVHDAQNAVTVGASWKFEPPIDGLYSVNVNVRTASVAWATDEVAYINLYVNGSIRRMLDYYQCDNANTRKVQLFGATIVDLDTTNDLDVRIYHNQGGAVAMSGVANENSIQIALIGPPAT